MSKSSGKSTIIIIRQEDLPAIRKKQAPPAQIMRDRTAYRRKDKHAKRGDASGQDKTPGWDIPTGRFAFLSTALHTVTDAERCLMRILTLMLAARLGFDRCHPHHQT